MQGTVDRPDESGGGELPKGFTVRGAAPEDHQRIIAVLKEWWDGRDLTGMVPRLFLIHFCDTSAIVERDGEMAAFLIGFFSQSRKSEGYIHFAGVHPRHRGSGLGSYLYRRFFNICRSQGRLIVRACTSPVNTGSIAFHQKMGFVIAAGDAVVDGVEVTRNYNRPGDHKVRFEKQLEPMAR